MLACLWHKEGRREPVVICDHCCEIIRDARKANEVAAPPGDDCSAEAIEGDTVIGRWTRLYHAHKGECERALTARLDARATVSQDMSSSLFGVLGG